jgi:hypothetical protein
MLRQLGLHFRAADVAVTVGISGFEAVCAAALFRQLKLLEADEPVTIGVHSPHYLLGWRFLSTT